MIDFEVNFDEHSPHCAKDQHWRKLSKWYRTIVPANTRLSLGDIAIRRGSYEAYLFAVSSKNWSFVDTRRIVMSVLLQSLQRGVKFSRDSRVENAVREIMKWCEGGSEERLREVRNEVEFAEIEAFDNSLLPSDEDQPKAFITRAVRYAVQSCFDVCTFIPQSARYAAMADYRQRKVEEPTEFDRQRDDLTKAFPPLHQRLPRRSKQEAR